MFGQIGPLEFAVLLVLAVIIFSHKKLPEIGKNIARGLKEFKKETKK